MLGLGKAVRVERGFNKAKDNVNRWKKEGIERKEWEELLKIPIEIAELMEEAGKNIADPDENKKTGFMTWASKRQILNSVLELTEELLELEENLNIKQ